MRPTTRRRLGLLLRALGLSAAIGAALGSARGVGFPGEPLAGALVGAGAGALNGLMLAGTVIAAEIFLPRTRLGHALDRAPFVVALALRLLVYGVVVVAIVGGRLGRRLAVALAEPVLGPDPALTGHIVGSPAAQQVMVAVVMLGAGILLLQIGRIVGDQTLRDIVLGRYHRSRPEERFFLFVDIVGSTPLAERVGIDAVHRFLGEVFRLASDPIDEHDGDVHQYVGDEVVITWTVADGRVRARPLACFFAIERALERAASGFERDFGAVPRLRAALHAGPVITGEVGGSRRAIVYHGDVMNTTARIEQATRDLGHRFLASEEAVTRLEGLEGFELEDLGRRELRGRAAPVRLYAITTRLGTTVEAAVEPGGRARVS
jgi:adenylate cyclase